MSLPFPVIFMLCDQENHSRDKIEYLMERGGYVLQRKYDGVRAQVWIDEEGTVSITGRNGQDLTGSFPEIVTAFQEAAEADRRGWTLLGLDGEIVSYDGEFSTVSSRAGTKNCTLRAAMVNPCYFACFDVLSISSNQNVHQDLVNFNARLSWLDWAAQQLKPSPFYVWVQYYYSMDYYDELCKDETAEGVVVKSVHGLYVKGRNKQWKKGKFEFMISCIVIDYDSSNHTLTYGLLDKNKDPVILGTTASGTSKDWQNIWERRLGPVFVEIKCNGIFIGENGKISLRHPTVHGRRLDVKCQDCTMSQLDSLPIR